MFETNVNLRVTIFPVFEICLCFIWPVRENMTFNHNKKAEQRTAKLLYFLIWMVPHLSSQKMLGLVMWADRSKSQTGVKESTGL